MNRKKTNRSRSVRETFSALSPDRKRRLMIKGAGAFAVLGVSAGALSAYDKKQRTLHDLSVIGQGNPVVVQIHDPACPTCRRLKSRSTTALQGKAGIVYRLADVTTAEGKELQSKYDVETITLLLFDGEGRRVRTIRGLQSVDYLEEAFVEAFRA